MYIRYNLRGTSLIKCRYTSSNLALHCNHIALRKFHKKACFESSCKLIMNIKCGIACLYMKSENTK